MPRQTDISVEIQALLGAIGWRDGDEVEDFDRVSAAGGQPRGNITANSILEKIHSDRIAINSNQAEQQESVTFSDSLADGFSRAARNKNFINEETEKKMREDKERSRLQKRPTPKDQ